MHNAFLLLALLSPGVCMSAQQAVVLKPEQSVGCPIGFSAQVNASSL
jgi:hypothetical protein